jgi:hypothetical protein
MKKQVISVVREFFQRVKITVEMMKTKSSTDSFVNQKPKLARPVTPEGYSPAMDAYYKWAAEFRVSSMVPKDF